MALEASDLSIFNVRLDPSDVKALHFTIKNLGLSSSCLALTGQDNCRRTKVASSKY